MHIMKKIVENRTLNLTLASVAMLLMLVYTVLAIFGMVYRELIYAAITVAILPWISTMSQLFRYPVKYKWYWIFSLLFLPVLTPFLYFVYGQKRAMRLYAKSRMTMRVS